MPLSLSTRLSLQLALLASASTLAADRAQAQPAPAPRAVVTAAEQPEAMSGYFQQLEAGDTEISVPGAPWLQLRFEDYEIGPEGTITVTGETGESQTFTERQLEEWEGLTALFEGSTLTVSVNATEEAPGAPVDARVALAEIIVGLPVPGTEDGVPVEAAEPLQETFGGDLEDYIYDYGPEMQRFEQSLGDQGAAPEAICGATDDRTASTHPLVGRIMPIGCTGWIIGGGRVATAGHCISASTQILEFNVPASQANGTTRPAPVRDQYRVVQHSIVDEFSGLGNDWAIFQVLPNTETGLMPVAAQGGTFQLSNTANPTNVRITGFGVDGPAPHFGNPPPRDATNQTQQTHAGDLTNHTVGGPRLATILHRADTQPANSGSPVIAEGAGNVAIGIHTNGGCTGTGGANGATSFRNAALWNAIGRSADIVWQHRLGQVHYWPMIAGQRQGGINIHTPVGGDWRLVGAGDVTGDGTADIVWQHRSGQVHYWPIQNGQRQGGINIHTPVGGEWRLAGLGDVNGDGTADIIWQHREGQVHYWPIRDGQRQGGINIHTPVGGDWYLAGVGDVDGDATADIVWQHRAGQVHYWPIRNGQRQGGINIHSPVGGDWRLAAVGDVNGDGTADIVWQHRSGQVHYWPILAGQRQGGINIHTPVSGDWFLAGAGHLD
jgi:V8-like Glu-specific endopeptidase